MLPYFFNFVCKGHERGTVYNAEYEADEHKIRVSWQYHNGFELVNDWDYYDFDDVVEYVNDGIWIILSQNIEEDTFDLNMSEVI